MSRRVNPADPRPPYVQIADDLRAAIDADELKPGDRLPAGRELAAEYGVAAMTVQHAIRLLRDEGRVQTWQGRGVFVAPVQPDGDEQAAAESREDVLRRLTRLGRDVENLARRVSALEKKR
ncbi:GntR family transcriptional regulator [Actinopolymorpha singaporensis]